MATRVNERNSMILMSFSRAHSGLRVGREATPLSILWSTGPSCRRRGRGPYSDTRFGCDKRRCTDGGERAEGAQTASLVERTQAQERSRRPAVPHKPRHTRVRSRAAGAYLSSGVRPPGVHGLPAALYTYSDALDDARVSGRRRGPRVARASCPAAWDRRVLVMAPPMSVRFSGVVASPVGPAGLRTRGDVAAASTNIHLAVMTATPKDHCSGLREVPSFDNSSAPV